MCKCLWLEYVANFNLVVNSLGWSTASYFLFIYMTCFCAKNKSAFKFSNSNFRIDRLLTHFLLSSTSVIISWCRYSNNTLVLGEKYQNGKKTFQNFYFFILICFENLVFIIADIQLASSIIIIKTYFRKIISDLF